jgi:hypothetical protein
MVLTYSIAGYASLFALVCLFVQVEEKDEGL